MNGLEIEKATTSSRRGRRSPGAATAKDSERLKEQEIRRTGEKKKRKKKERPRGENEQDLLKMQWLGGEGLSRASRFKG